MPYMDPSQWVCYKYLLLKRGSFIFLGHIKYMFLGLPQLQNRSTKVMLRVNDSSDVFANPACIELL